MMSHVHLGTGRIGLGLIGEIVHDQSIRTVFINRKSSEIRHTLLKHGSYFLKVEENQKNISASFLQYDPQDINGSGSKEAREAIATASLITVAVGSTRMESLIPLLLAGLGESVTSKKLEQNKRIFLLAFENMENNSTVFWTALLRQAKRSGINEYIKNWVIPLDTIVDRICPEIKVDYPNPGGVCCLAEAYKEVIIKKPIQETTMDATTESFISHTDIKFVTEEEFALYQKRKYWLVNGVQLAIAIYGLQNECFLLKHAIERESIFRKINSIQTEFSSALEALSRDLGVSNDEFTLVALTRYNATVLERVRKAKEDTVNRILKEIVNYIEFSQEVAGFTRKLNEHNQLLLEKHSKNLREYHETFQTWINEEMVRFLLKYDVGAFIDKVTKRLCEPIKILNQHCGLREPPSASIAVLIDTLDTLNVILNRYKDQTKLLNTSLI